MTRTHHFQGQNVKGQGHQAAVLTAALTRETSCSGDRENVLGVGNYVASARRRARRWGAHGGRRRAGHIVSPRAQLAVIVTVSFCALTLLVG